MRVELPAWRTLAGLQARIATRPKLHAGIRYSLDANLTHVNEGRGVDVLLVIFNRDLTTCKHFGIAVYMVASSTGRPCCLR